MKKNTLIKISSLILVSVLIIFLISCTTSETSTNDDEDDYDEEFVDFSGAIVSSSLADLPTPSASNIGQLYYVIADAKFYYSDGTQYVFIDLTGPSGSNGANGTDGVSITWQGSLATAPASPQVNWAYYNTTDNVAYIWDGDSWEILVQDGSDGVSVNWLGTFAAAPGSPQLNDGYYNSTDGMAYIWDGDS